MKHIVVNKVVEEEVQSGYVQRLSKGQASGVAELEEVRRFCQGSSRFNFLDSMTKWHGSKKPRKNHGNYGNKTRWPYAANGRCLQIVAM